MARRKTLHAHEPEDELDKLLRSKATPDIDVPTKSLFEAILDRRFPGGDEESKSLLHRMVIISKLSRQNSKEIGEYYENYFKTPQNQFHAEGVTGLLLIYPRHCVHVIESSTETLLDICRDISRGEGTGSGPTTKSKIIIVSHDIPQRLYQQWNFRGLDIEAPRVEEYDLSEDPVHLMEDISIQLLKLGAYLARQPNMALKNTMDALHDKVPELLPQQDSIGCLLETQEGPIETPEDFVNKYERPYDISLASEMTWPMPVTLFPYN